MKKYFQEIYYKLIPNLTVSYFKSNYAVEFFNTEKNYGHITAKRSYALRHKVYCDELGFEDTTKTQQEFDEYDKNSIGCLISTKVSKYKIKKIKIEDPSVGSVRLIFPSKINPHKELPCLEAIKSLSPKEYLEIKEQFNGYIYAEISRLLILNTFRNTSIFKIEGTLKNNYLLLSLFAASFVLCDNLDFAIFMCEKKLMRFLKKAGIPYTQLMKKGIDHRGIRYPIKLNISECKKELEKQLTPTIRIIFSLVNLMKAKAPEGTYQVRH